MATCFNTQVAEGQYRLQFTTDNKKHYQFIQSVARKCVDGTIADKIDVVGVGQWTAVRCEDWRYGVWSEHICSCCKSQVMDATPHCPMCGAKMLGGFEDVD